MDQDSTCVSAAPFQAYGLEHDIAGGQRAQAGCHHAWQACWEHVALR